MKKAFVGFVLLSPLDKVCSEWLPWTLVTVPLTVTVELGDERRRRMRRRRVGVEGK